MANQVKKGRKKNKSKIGNTVTDKTGCTETGAKCQEPPNTSEVNQIQKGCEKSMEVVSEKVDKRKASDTEEWTGKKRKPGKDDTESTSNYAQDFPLTQANKLIPVFGKKSRTLLTTKRLCDDIDTTTDNLKEDTKLPAFSEPAITDEMIPTEGQTRVMPEQHGDTGEVSHQNQMHIETDGDRESTSSINEHDCNTEHIASQILSQQAEVVDTVNSASSVDISSRQIICEPKPEESAPSMASNQIYDKIICGPNPEESNAPSKASNQIYDKIICEPNLEESDASNQISDKIIYGPKPEESDAPSKASNQISGKIICGPKPEESDAPSKASNQIYDKEHPNLESGEEPVIAQNILSQEIGSSMEIENMDNDVNLNEPTNESILDMETPTSDAQQDSQGVADDLPPVLDNCDEGALDKGNDSSGANENITIAEAVGSDKPKQLDHSDNPNTTDSIDTSTQDIRNADGHSLQKTELEDQCADTKHYEGNTHNATDTDNGSDAKCGTGSLVEDDDLTDSQLCMMDDFTEHVVPKVAMQLPRQPVSRQPVQLQRPVITKLQADRKATQQIQSMISELTSLNGMLLKMRSELHGLHQQQRMEHGVSIQSTHGQFQQQSGCINHTLPVPGRYA